MQGLYHIWLARNGAKESERIEAARTIAERVVQLVEELHSLQNDSTVMPNLVPTECWLQPEEGWTKANTDGAMSKSGDKGGGGVVLRDHHGMFLAGACHFSPPPLIPSVPNLRLVAEQFA